MIVSHTHHRIDEHGYTAAIDAEAPGGGGVG